MSFEYEYENITSKPNIWTGDEYGELCSGIHYDVLVSTMDNKNIQWCCWNEKDEILHVFWDVELSEADKAKLDTIVEDNT